MQSSVVNISRSKVRQAARTGRGPHPSRFVIRFPVVDGFKQSSRSDDIVPLVGSELAKPGRCRGLTIWIADKHAGYFEPKRRMRPLERPEEFP
jgi:hypothetical protein